MIVKVDEAGRILLPAQTRKFLGIEKGRYLKVELVYKKIIITILEEEEEEQWKKTQE